MITGRELTYLITGVSGQDGFFSARHFLKNGARVVGVSRTPLARSNPQLWLLNSYPAFNHVHMPEYTAKAINDLFSAVKPDRLVHCAGFRDIPSNPDEVRQCFFTNCDLLEMLLEGLVKHAPDCHVVFLSSAEIFRKDSGGPLNESSPIGPDNEYGVSKVRGMQIMRYFMKHRAVSGSSAICFNHDSFLSPSAHLVRLVPKKLLMVKRRLLPRASFFNVEIRRDWSHAKDFSQAFDLMLEQSAPEDYVVASGNAISLKNYVSLSCRLLRMEVDEVVDFVVRDSETSYSRVADSRRIKSRLGWQPKYDIERLCSEMIGWEGRGLAKVS